MPRSTRRNAVARRKAARLQPSRVSGIVGRMVVSVDPEIDSDIPAMIGASAALVLSGVPFAGPIGLRERGEQRTEVHVFDRW
mgnify:CR=1 FL=1